MKTMQKHRINFKKTVLFSLALFVLSSAALLISGCRAAQNNSMPVSETFIACDTVVTITLYDTDDMSIIEECIELCKKYDALLSVTNPESDIYKINHAEGKPVKADPHTLYLIREALSYCQKTDGKIDITIGAVKELWHFDKKEHAGDAAVLPDETALRNALSHVDYRCVLCDDAAQTVTLTDAEAMIDLGFIAKGYIADELKTCLQARGVKSAVIDLGGNILTIGSKPDHTPFRIGVKKPFSETESMTVLTVSDQSVVTSGIYERYTKAGDILYHHVLDPSTGYPADTDLLSVTVISDSSLHADALSTACLLLGSREGAALIDGWEHTEAVFITKDYRILDTRSRHTTSSFEGSLRFATAMQKSSAR